MPEPSCLTAGIGLWLVPGAILISGTIAATVAIVAILQQRAIARKRAIIDNIFNRIWDKDYIENRKTFVKLRNDPSNLLDVAKELNQAGNDAVAIRSILNDYEATALGIKLGILDGKIYELWFKTSFLRDCQAMRPYIESIRQNNPKAYVELQGLAKKWGGWKTD